MQNPSRLSYTYKLSSESLLFNECAHRLLSALTSGTYPRWFADDPAVLAALAEAEFDAGYEDAAIASRARVTH